MKWTSHVVLTFGISYIFSEDIIFSLGTMAGALLPDKLEGKPPDSHKDYKGYWRWRSNHRKLTHWFVVYVIFILIFWLLKEYYVIDKLEIFVLEFAINMCIGALMHILQDALCGKVPITSLKQRKCKGLSLFKVGGFGELFFLMSVLGVSYYVKNHNVLNSLFP